MQFLFLIRKTGVFLVLEETMVSQKWKGYVVSKIFFFVFFKKLLSLRKF